MCQIEPPAWMTKGVESGGGAAYANPAPAVRHTLYDRPPLPAVLRLHRMALTEALSDALQSDKEHPDAFSEVPFYYQQIAAVLLAGAADDVPDRALVAELLDDIERSRQVKLSNTVKTALGWAATMEGPMLYELQQASAGEVTMLRNGFFK